MSAAEFELSVTCHVAAPREIAWKVWTDLKDEWFCPKPWRAEVIEEDLRPGGRSAVRMFGPEGEDTGPMEGIFLEVVPGEKVVTTANALHDRDLELCGRGRGNPLHRGRPALGCGGAGKAQGDGFPSRLGPDGGTVQGAVRDFGGERLGDRGKTFPLPFTAGECLGLAKASPIPKTEKGGPSSPPSLHLTE